MPKPAKEDLRAKKARPVDACALPPYGVVNADNVGFLSRRPVPAGFRAEPGSKQPSHAEEWESWLLSTASHMSDFLWPVYRGNGWEGQSSANATALTVLDLKVLRSLQGRFQQRIAGQNAATARQSEAFQKEDEGPPGSTFAFYQSGFPAYLESELNRAIVSGGIEIARPASQGMKRLFQRPRPQQTALLLGVDEITVQPSKSAITPAMISGHCIQGCVAFAQVLASMSDLPETQLNALGRFLIDTGDRRVYAGLHYPTDNIGSWYVALRLCAHVFGDRAQAVRSGLWNAIRDHSAVYSAVEAAARNPSQGLESAPQLYAPALQELQRAAEGGMP